MQVFYLSFGRAGSNAIYEWLCSLFPNHEYLRCFDQAIDIPKLRQDNIVARRELNGEWHPFELFVNNYVLPVDQLCLGFRDPLNNLASNIKAGFRTHTVKDTQRFFIDNWLTYYKWAKETDYQIILYNKWYSSKGYREQVCNNIGGIYCEDTLDHVHGMAGGSSFDGNKIPPKEMNVLTRYLNYLDDDRMKLLLDNEEIIQICRQDFDMNL